MIDCSSEHRTLRRQARLAGLLYLIIILGAGFAEGVVRGGIIVPGDVQATAEAIRGAPVLFSLGLVLDLVAFMADAGVAVLLYLVLRHVNQGVAMAAAAFRLIAHPAIASVNLLNHWAAGLFAARPSFLGGFTPEQLDGLAYLGLELHGYGYLISGAFFGVHLMLLGWLLLRSARFPGWLGVMVAVAGTAYLAETFASFAAPALAGLATVGVVIAASLAEVTLCGWLLVRGVRPPREAE